MSVAIKLTLPEALVEQTQKHVQAEGYSNIQEFILEAMRKFNKEKENQKMLQKFYGLAQGTPLTKEERKKFSSLLLQTHSQQLFREFNLDSVADAAKVSRN